MAMGGNELYPYGKEALLQKKIDVEDVVATGNLMAALVKSSYSPSYSHQFFKTITDASQQIDSSVALASSAVSVDTGTGAVTFDAVDVVFSSVTTGNTVGAIVVYVNGASPGTDDYLLALFSDDGSAISLPTNGGDITVSWNASGLFAL